jgi:hypothetical protein
VGFAIFPTRSGGGRVVFDADLSIGMAEDYSRNGTGPARIYIRDIPASIALRDNWNTVLAQINANRSIGGRFAIFPTTGNGGRAMFDADLIIGLSEDQAQDGTGRGRIYVQGILPTPITLDESAQAAYDRIVAARALVSGIIG